ncbi:G5 domain-containing protein [Candidatus Saccharibacteria bacterium]|nr:G5 domain-containing protein [Candidatus Saccharibacteria bacterium]
MKLRTHTISVSRLSYIGTFALVGLVFGFLVIGNISRAHAEDVLNAIENDSESISDTHFVTFHENGSSLTIKTDAKTVEDALKRAKIEVAPEDVVDPKRDAKISDDYHINIYRARPVIVSDGLTKKYIMSASYDKETLAKEAGFKIYDGDVIELKVETAKVLEAGLTDTYEIKRKGGTTITVEEEIPYAEKTEQDSSLAAGQKKEKQIGELGKRVITYEVKFKDGVEVERTKVSEEVTKQPVDKITVVGSKVAEVTATPDHATCESWMRAAGIAEGDMETAWWIIFKESKCRYNATNRSSGAYGIPQALPGKKMAAAGADWETNPVTQIKWMISYVNGRYGGWEGAKAWWLSHGWY